MSSAGVRVFTVQVDGGTKPAFLFSLVPYTPNYGNTQANDPLGVLMYWHPTYIHTYTDFLSALASHLNTSPYRVNILGIRMNFNAVGTEQIAVPTANQKASTWTVPPGVTNGPDWTLAISQDYQATVIDAHVAGFGTDPSSTRVFARVTIDSAILTHQATGQPAGFAYSDYFKQAKLGLFFTGGAPELPSFQDVASIYSFDSTYLIPGLTTGYSEPVSDAWGVTGSPANPLPHSITPPQWNYWRILADLTLGMSDIALYGVDVLVATTGVHYGHDVGADYQAEFDAAFRFAARYAGFHADPVNSPGAWIAFRQTTTNIPASAPDYRKLTDYRRFITLLNPQDTIGLDARSDGTPVPVIANKTVAGEQSIGPYYSRFGAWARAIPDGHVAQLQLDATFRNTVNQLTGAVVNVTYLDNSGASFVTTLGDQTVTTNLRNSGTWQMTSIPVVSAFAANAAGGDIAIQAFGGTVTLHMVEVAKPAAAIVNAVSGQPTLAPGAFFSIYGQNLAGLTDAASAFPLPGQLGDTQVTIGGYPAPLLYVSPLQINGQVPYEVAPCGTAAPACPASTVTATRNGVSQTMTALLHPAAPATLAVPPTPAAAGSVVTIYLTGLGNVSNAPPDGAAASASVLSEALMPTTATLDGAPARVLFAGLTPGFAGLGQVSLQIPPATRPGPHTLIIRVGADATPPTTIMTN